MFFIIHGIISQIVFWYFDIYLLYIITITNDMKTAQKIVNNFINENIVAFKIRSLRQDVWYLGKTNLCQNTHFIYEILQYTYFNCTYYTCSYVKWEWDMIQYPRLFDLQDFRYWLCTYILECFGQVVHSLRTCLSLVWWPDALVHDNTLKLASTHGSESLSYRTALSTKHCLLYGGS